MSRTERALIPQQPSDRGASAHALGVSELEKVLA